MELETVRDLMEDGCVVIAAGGGGIPVTVRDGVHTAVDAIVDKDLTSAILAWRVRADILVILTAVEKVYLDFGKPTQKALDAMTVSEARAYMEQGQFAPGSMLPKVQACVKFVEAHPGGRAVITSLDHAAAGQRYCINGSALRLIPVDKLKAEGYGYLRISVFHTSAYSSSIAERRWPMAM